MDQNNMKIRSGFVSNSSSSSFVFVGFPKSEINDFTTSPMDEVKSKISKREIDEFAYTFFRKVSEYNAYQYGKVSDDFWKIARKHFSEKLGDYEIPEGYTIHCVWDGDQSVPWMGIDVTNLSDSGMVELNPVEIINIQNKIKKDFPKVNSRVMIGSNC